MSEYLKKVDERLERNRRVRNRFVTFQFLQHGGFWILFLSMALGIITKPENPLGSGSLLLCFIVSVLMLAIGLIGEFGVRHRRREYHAKKLHEKDKILLGPRGYHMNEDDYNLK